MKKIILCIAIFMACVINQASAYTITIKVSGERCSGAGFSCIEIDIDVSAIKTDAVYSSTGVTFTLDEANMKKLAGKNFTSGFVTVDNNVVLNNKICDTLKAPKGTTLIKNRYEFTKNGSMYVVKFAVK